MKAVRNITTESLIRAAKKARNSRPPKDAKPEVIYTQAFIEGCEYMRCKAMDETSFLRRRIDELKASVQHFKRANLKLEGIVKKLMKKLNL